MLKLIYFAFIIFISVQISNVVAKDYNGYKLYKVIPRNVDDVKLLETLRDHGVGEFWDDNINAEDNVKVMVAQNMEDLYLSSLKRVDLETEVVIEDLQHAIDNQNPTTRNTQVQNSLLSFSWDRYYNLSAIYNWLDELEEAYPNIVTTIVIGTSIENRQIKGIRINYHPERSNRTFGVLEGTIHAREWISPATVTWIIKEFLTSTDPAVRNLAEDIDWYIFPVVNPDGYVYTFTENRMWRKNRNTASFRQCAVNVDDDMSNGVDLNRNFDFYWLTVGASNDSCTNTYAGTAAGSEPETRALKQFILELNERGEITYYIAFHSYTQLIIIPYSHITSQETLTANNYADMYEVAIKGAERLSERYGTTYRVGLSADVMYPMSGSSVDWVKANADAKMAYLFEVRDLGEYGFLLPASQIIPNCLEVMDGFIEMDRNTRALGYYSSSMHIVYSFHLVLIGGLLAVLNC